MRTTIRLWLLASSLLLSIACTPIGNKSVENEAAPTENAPSPTLLTDENQSQLAEVAAVVEVLEDGGDETAVSQPEPTAQPTPTESPSTSQPDSAIEYDANGIQVGFTADGYPYRGNPDANIVIEEFSDFQ